MLFVRRAGIGAALGLALGVAVNHALPDIRKMAPEIPNIVKRSQDALNDAWNFTAKKYNSLVPREIEKEPSFQGGSTTQQFDCADMEPGQVVILRTEKGDFKLTCDGEAIDMIPPDILIDCRKHRCGAGALMFRRDGTFQTSTLK